MTSYRVERFMNHDDHPAIELDRRIEDEIHPAFRLIGQDDEMANVMFALYDGDDFQQRWYPGMCGVLVDYLHTVADEGYLWVHTWAEWQRCHYDSDEQQRFDEAADYISEAV